MTVPSPSPATNLCSSLEPQGPVQPHPAIQIIHIQRSHEAEVLSHCLQLVPCWSHSLQDMWQQPQNSHSIYFESQAKKTPPANGENRRLPNVSIRLSNKQVLLYCNCLWKEPQLLKAWLQSAIRYLTWAFRRAAAQILRQLQSSSDTTSLTCSRLTLHGVTRQHDTPQLPSPLCLLTPSQPPREVMIAFDSNSGLVSMFTLNHVHMVA